jgi:hypothetical protein
VTLEVLLVKIRVSTLPDKLKLLIRYSHIRVKLEMHKPLAKPDTGQCLGLVA